MWYKYEHDSFGEVEFEVIQLKTWEGEVMKEELGDARRVDGEPLSNQEVNSIRADLVQRELLNV